MVDPLNNSALRWVPRKASGLKTLSRSLAFQRESKLSDGAATQSNGSGIIHKPLPQQPLLALCLLRLILCKCELNRVSINSRYRPIGAPYHVTVLEHCVVLIEAFLKAPYPVIELFPVHFHVHVLHATEKWITYQTILQYHCMWKILRRCHGVRFVFSAGTERGWGVDWYRHLLRLACLLSRPLSSLKKS